MNPLQRIEDDLAIRDLVARFADSVNRKVATQMYPLFTDDIVLEVVGFGVWSGADAVVTFLDDILSLWEGFVQAVHSGVVTLEGGPLPQQATGRWYLSEFGVREGLDSYASGSYSDHYVKENGVWRFSQRRFDLLYFRQGGTVTTYPVPPELQ